MDHSLDSSPVTTSIVSMDPDSPTPQPSPVRRAFFGDDGLRAGWSLLLFFALLFVIGRGTNQLVHALHPNHLSTESELPPGLSLAFEAIQFGLVGLCTLIMSRVERRPLRAYGIGATPRAIPHFLAGLAWGAALLSVLVGTLFATHFLVFTGIQLSGPAILRFAAEWFAAFLFVGLFEEYALRGYLQFTLARGLAGAFHAATASPYAKAIGFWISAAIFSFIFGFGHKSNSGESPVGLVSAGLIGLVFCVSLWRTGSLWWAIGFHAAWDWTQSFIYGVADSGHMVAFHLLGSHPQGKTLLSGGLTGPEGSLIVLPVIVLAVAVILITVRRTGWPTPGSRAPGLDAESSQLPGATSPSPLLS